LIYFRRGGITDSTEQADGAGAMAFPCGGLLSRDTRPKAQ
jgi:hypothetical protein